MENKINIKNINELWQKRSCQSELFINSRIESFNQNLTSSLQSGGVFLLHRRFGSRSLSFPLCNCGDKKGGNVICDATCIRTCNSDKNTKIPALSDSLTTGTSMHIEQTVYSFTLNEGVASSCLRAKVITWI